MMWEPTPQIGGFLAERLPASLRNVLAWKQQSRLLADLAYFQHAHVNITGQDKPEQVESVAASTNFLDMLGVQAVLGRGFTSADAPEKKGQVALISYVLFERKFGKDSGVIGKTIRVDAVPYRIVGV